MRKRHLPTSVVAILVQDLIHGAIITIVVICVTFLTYHGKLSTDVPPSIFTLVVGYVGGRSGSVARGGVFRGADNGDTGGDGP